MTRQLILDVKADFYTNVGQFPFIDPTTGVRFEPDLQIKTPQTDWMKGQSCIQKVIADKPAKTEK